MRSCIGGKPGENGCDGLATAARPCNEQPCPSWSNWQGWQPCDVTCGIGWHRRERRCGFGVPGTLKECQGQGTQRMACYAGLCEFWSTWTKWADCSATCGVGVASRARTCTNGEPGMPGCQGDEKETKECDEKICEFWSTWNAWAECSLTCGGGVTSRARTCTNGEPGMPGCQGDEEETEDCNKQICESWSTWNEWEDCSVTCGLGKTSRSRTCKNGDTGMPGCEGDEKEIKQCDEGKCEAWTKWSRWSACSTTCGGGMRTRNRTCSYGEVGEGACIGNTEEQKSCADKPCPVWTNWSQWTSCSTTCGIGASIRNRSCENGVVGDEGCSGDPFESRECFEKECEYWIQWSFWSDCDVTCGSGSMSRIRICVNGDPGIGNCTGFDTDTKPCNAKDCEFWGPWGAWGQCNATCGEGVELRYRDCYNGEVGQGACQGQDVDSGSCIGYNCSNWTNWGQWGECSATCGEGERIRERVCNKVFAGARDCEGPAQETMGCNEKVCEKWRSWSEWSVCNATCGVDGIRMRLRDCENGKAGEGACVGPTTDIAVCVELNCAYWTTWAEWTACSVTCGGGARVRNRTCVDGDVGDTGCEGATFETKECGKKDCEYWSPWNEWSICDTTCGIGNQKRDRTCIHGDPGMGACSGSTQDQKECVGTKCPYWTMWTSWSQCSANCGGGVMLRNRTCVYGVPGESGCDGSELEEQLCNEEECQKWAEWGNWGECSKTCGVGERERIRSCIAPNLLDCDENEGREVENCAIQDCPVWSPWSLWSDCSQTCGQGVKERSRICINITPDGDCGGGNATEEMDCNTQECPIWTLWTVWTECSKTCGRGLRLRSRECRNGIAGDIGCDIVNDLGENHQEFCNEQACPRWGDWSLWSGCSASCDTGVITHTRECIGGEVGQLGCEGPVSEDKECKLKECSFWSTWGLWGDCTEPCGGGQQFRYRGCLNGEVGEPGCMGEMQDSKECNTIICAFWSEWGSWGYCSATCGGGDRYRTRNCVNGNIGEEGCSIEDSTSKEPCATEPCPTCDPDLEKMGIANGIVDCDIGTSIGAVCHYTCEAEYQLLGVSATMCVETAPGVANWRGQPPTCTKKCSDAADIIFVVDSSSSIKTPNFRIVRSFLKEIVKRFRVGADAALFGALRYNKVVDKLWNLNDYSTQQEVLNAITRIPYDGSGTKTGAALNFTRQHMLSEDVGRRPDVPVIVLVITDGVSFDDVRVPAQLLKEDNVLMISVGIGNVNIGEIYSIASERNFATTVSSFDSLKTVINTIADQIKLCQPVSLPPNCPPQAIMDMVFIVDSSSSVGKANFEIMREFIISTVEKFNVGPDSALFGVILYNRRVIPKFELKDHQTSTDVISAIKEIVYSGKGTRTGQALSYAAEKAFLASAGGRPGVPKVALVLTDGKSQDDVSEAAKELQETAYVISIGIKGADLAEIRTIASDPSNAYKAEDFSALPNVLGSISAGVCFASRSGTIKLP